MTQLILNIEDASLLTQIKKACSLLRGVGEIAVRKDEAVPNKTTQKAMAAAKKGETIKCGSFEEYLKCVQ
jgi:hypothetical protein